jgi:hypothetical protein
MKPNKILIALSLIVSVGLLTQCEKYGDHGGPTEPDPDSDRPEWAGGNTDNNPHIKGNDDSGTTRGGDYGDLYVLYRDLDNSGVPFMLEINGEYYVQPLDEDGYLIERYSNEDAPGEVYTENEDQWGELVNPTAVQEVDFGRLNIVRSPTSVLNQALGEALKVLDPDNGDVYPATISLDFCGRLTSEYFNEELNEWVVKTIDSPRENMAIYRTIMQDLTDDRLAFLGTLDPLTIAASCFAAGSDKTGTVDVDEVVYINGFMDCEGNNAIPNENDYDFNNEQNYYYNFDEPGEGQSAFSYNRAEAYGARWLSIKTLFPNNTWDEEVITVLEAMENRGLFTERWDEMGTLTPVESFAKAVDDAVQVLDFVHGDSNIDFLPDGPPPTP